MNLSPCFPFSHFKCCRSTEQAQKPCHYCACWKRHAEHISGRIYRYTVPYKDWDLSENVLVPIQNLKMILDRLLIHISNTFMLITKLTCSQIDIKVGNESWGMNMHQNTFTNSIGNLLAFSQLPFEPLDIWKMLHTNKEGLPFVLKRWKSALKSAGFRQRAFQSDPERSSMQPVV